MDEYVAVLLFGVMDDKEKHAGFVMGLEQIVFLVAGDATYLEVLGVVAARLAVPIDHVEDIMIGAAKDGYVKGALADEHLGDTLICPPCRLD